MAQDKSVTIVLTGGGTGGHIMPILAVAHEIKRQQPDAHLIYVGERGGKFGDLTDGEPAIDESYAVLAGKYRRYHTESLVKRLLDVKTNLKNIRDVFYVFIGVVQAWRLLGKLRPDLVFMKGGFVGVPMGLAAAMRKIPIVTHDSDAVPGLANRLVGRWATMHAVALPEETYAYPKSKTKTVGVLVEHSYQPVTARQQQVFKEKVGVPIDKPLLLITGGSSGAERLNDAVIACIEQLLDQQEDLYVIHQVGKGKGAAYEDFSHPRLQIKEFLSPMYQYTGAADLVIARASANTFAELGVQGKATIAVPSPFLAGGHQLKNADRLRGLQASEIIFEEDLLLPEKGILSKVQQLFTDKKRAGDLAANLQKNTALDAASKLSSLLLDIAAGRRSINKIQ